jgi:hypothetical protein
MPGMKRAEDANDYATDAGYGLRTGSPLGADYEKLHDGGVRDSRVCSCIGVSAPRRPAAALCYRRYSAVAAICRWGRRISAIFSA